MMQMTTQTKDANQIASRKTSERSKVGLISEEMFDNFLTTQETIKVDDFIAIADHPRQRDTERHLTKALKKNLAQYSPTQERVNIATLNGKRYKLDGHTRALAWSLGKLRRPKVLKADVYHCDTMDQLLELYTHFDNKDAVETKPDILSGALRQEGVDVNSQLLRKYSFATSLQVASRAFGVEESNNPYLNVAEFADELRALDALDPSEAVFKVGVIAGSLILLRKHGAKIIPFLEALSNNAGIKGANECDAAYALYDISIRQNKGRSGFSRTLELAGKTVSCGDKYLKGENYIITRTGVSVKMTKIASYLKGLKKQKQP